MDGRAAPFVLVAVGAVCLLGLWGAGPVPGHEGSAALWRRMGALPFRMEGRANRAHSLEAFEGALRVTAVVVEPPAVLVTGLPNREGWRVSAGRIEERSGHMVVVLRKKGRHRLRLAITQGELEPRPWRSAALVAGVALVLAGLTWLGLRLGLAGTPPVSGRALAAVLGLLLASATVMHWSIENKTPTADARLHYRYGAQILDGDAERFDDSMMPVQAMNAVPARVAPYLGGGRLRNHLADWESGRNVTILWWFALGLLVFVWTHRLYGVAAALFTTGLFAFEPNLMAHGRLHTPDLYATAAVAFTVYAFWRFCDEGGWGRGLVCAVALGVAQVAKYTSPFLYPILALVAVARFGPTLWHQARGGAWARALAALARAVAWALAFLVVTVLVLNVAFLFLRPFTPLAEYRLRSRLFRGLQERFGWLPVPVPYPYLQGLDSVRFKEEDGCYFVYLLGRRSSRGFWFYFLVAGLFKLPLGLQIAFLAAIGWRLRAPPGERLLPGEIFLAVPAAFLAVQLSFFFVHQIGIRYALPILPLVIVFSGSLVKGWDRFGRRARLGVAALVIWVVASTLSWHPHYISYVNELLWDRRMIYKILSDSNVDWDQNEWYLQRYLEANPGVHVSPAGPTSGTVVVRVNDLTGSRCEMVDRYRWLRDHFEPAGHVAYSYLVFVLRPEDLARFGMKRFP